MVNIYLFKKLKYLHKASEIDTTKKYPGTSKFRYIFNIILWTEVIARSRLKALVLPFEISVEFCRRPIEDGLTLVLCLPPHNFFLESELWRKNEKERNSWRRCWLARSLQRQTNKLTPGRYHLIRTPTQPMLSCWLNFKQTGYTRPWLDVHALMRERDADRQASLLLACRHHGRDATSRPRKSRCLRNTAVFTDRPRLCLRRLHQTRRWRLWPK
jgi:hypothetical protein